MNKWKTRELTRACIFSGLLALLMGCDNDGGDTTSTTATDGTFVAEVKKDENDKKIDDKNVPDEPVVGIVTAVPDTEPEKVISDPRAPTQTIVTEGEVKSYEPPAKRFIETAPDAAGEGTYESSPTYDYNLGNLVAAASNDSGSFSDSLAVIAPVKGWVRYPITALHESPKKYPVVVFLHGQHEDSDREHSYQGYNYLAEKLVPHGYVVVSINARKINDGPRSGDSSSQSRAQLVLGTLDRLRQIDGFGQIDLGGNKGKLDPLINKLDFSRIGIMGHSRGGQGISNTIIFNRSRHATTPADLRALLKERPDSFKPYPELLAAAEKVGPDGDTAFEAARVRYNIFYASGSGTEPPYDFKGAFMMAPTDNAGNTGLNKVPLANLVPSCDGDVNDLAGAIAYDHNRFGDADDHAPRYQILVHGANHNYYNTEWKSDDFNYPKDGAAYCIESHPTSIQPDSIRLNREDQERTGLFLINSFMRYHVGGEQKFATYWNGTAQLPAEACPKAAKGPCDQQIVLTIQKGSNSRKLIQRFEADGTLNKSGKNTFDSTKINTLGGAVTFSGFDAYARYAMVPGGGSALQKSEPARFKGFAYDYGYGKGFQSVADHVELVWSKPATTKPETPTRQVVISEELKDLSANGYDSLTFRVAVVRPMGQEVLVTLTDTAGISATVTASDFSDALYNAPRRKTYPFKQVPAADASTGSRNPAEVPRSMIDLTGNQTAFEVPSAEALVGQPERVPDPASDIPLLDHKDDTPYANGQVKMLLNMVAIPLKAFEGIDLEHLKELKLAFPKKSGKVAITDIELQNFGRDQRLAEIAWSQAGMLGGTSGGIALGGNPGPDKTASGKIEDKLLLISR
jgi:hypothetical protein